MRASKLLVVRTRGRDLFYLPGGKPELGESLPRALGREVAEELGLAVDANSIVEAFVVTDRADGLPHSTLRLHCFRADAPGEPQPAREIEELSWVGQGDESICAPAVTQVLDLLFGRRSRRDSQELSS